MAEEFANFRGIRCDLHAQIGCGLNCGVGPALYDRLVRTNDERIKIFCSVTTPFGKILLRQRQRRDEDQRERTLQSLGDPQCGECLAGAAGHDESAAVLVAEPLNNGIDRGHLVNSGGPSIQRRGGVSNLIRPFNFFGQEMTTQNKADRFLLTVQRPPSCGSNVVRRGHEQSICELRTVGFGKERVDFSFGNRAIGMIGFCLDCPQFSRSRAGDDVDSGIGAPPIRPILPQPHFIELTPIPRRILEEPFAQPFEVASKRCPLRITANPGFDGLKRPGDKLLFVAFRHCLRLK